VKMHIAYRLAPTPAPEAPGNQSWKSNFLAIIEDARTPIPSPVAALTGFELSNFRRITGRARFGAGSYFADL
jgi:hypothetical protein